MGLTTTAIVTILIAAAVAIVMSTVVDVSTKLPDDIVTALTRPEPDRERDSWIIVCGAPTAVDRGIQSGLIGLLFGGVPAAILASALEAFSRKARRRWSAGWAPLFVAGFAFQVSSMAWTALFLTLLFLFGTVRGELLLFGGFFVVNLVSGAIGLRCWWALQRNVREDSLTILAITEPSSLVRG